MLIVNLNFAAEQVAELLHKIGCQTLIINKIIWKSGGADFCRPVILPVLYLILPNGDIAEANDLLSNKIKIKILKFLKRAS